LYISGELLVSVCKTGMMCTLGPFILCEMLRIVHEPLFGLDGLLDNVTDLFSICRKSTNKSFINSNTH